MATEKLLHGQRDRDFGLHVGTNRWRLDFFLGDPNPTIPQRGVALVPLLGKNLKPLEHLLLREALLT